MTTTLSPSTTSGATTTPTAGVLDTIERIAECKEALEACLDAAQAAFERAARIADTLPLGSERDEFIAAAKTEYRTSACICSTEYAICMAAVFV